MTNYLSSIHPVLRFTGVIGLFLVLLSSRSGTELVLIPESYRLYVVVASALLISLGLYIKLRYSEEKPSIITYISTFVTLLVAMSISIFLLSASLM